MGLEAEVDGELVGMVVELGAEVEVEMAREEE